MTRKNFKHIIKQINFSSYLSFYILLISFTFLIIVALIDNSNLENYLFLLLLFSLLITYLIIKDYHTKFKIKTINYERLKTVEVFKENTSSLVKNLQNISSSNLIFSSYDLFFSEIPREYENDGYEDCDFCDSLLTNKKFKIIREINISKKFKSKTKFKIYRSVKLRVLRFLFFPLSILPIFWGFNLEDFNHYLFKQLIKKYPKLFVVEILDEHLSVNKSAKFVLLSEFELFLLELSSIKN